MEKGDGRGVEDSSIVHGSLSIVDRQGLIFEQPKLIIQAMNQKRLWTVVC